MVGVIVRLTHQQGRAVLDRCDDQYRGHLLHRRIPYGRRQHDYELPAIGWRTLLDRLEAEAWGPKGGKRRDRPNSFYTGLSRIHAAVARREHHPALAHQGVMGVDDEIIPVFSNGRDYSPYPADDRDTFLILVPRAHEVRGHTITEWVVGDRPRSEYLMHPGDHLRFVMT